MNRIFKRLLCIITAMTVAMSMFVMNTSAAGYLGTLTYWESDEDLGAVIGEWINKPNVKLAQYSSSFTNFTSYVSGAISQWKNAGIPLTNYSSGNSDITIYGQVDNFYLTVLNKSFESDIILGRTYASHATDGFYYYNGNMKNRKIYYYALVLVRKDISANTGNRLYNTCLHEMGHALGWLGHCADTSDENVMRKESTTTTTLSAKDKRHLYQLYN